MPHAVRPSRAVVAATIAIPAAIALLVLVAGCSTSERSSPIPITPSVQHLTVMPVTTPPPRQIVTAAADVRVMSFNLRCPSFIDGFNHWNFRKDLMLATIRRFNPDILGTQECVLEQANYLRENLSEYEFVGAGRNDGKDSGEMCGVFFKRAKYDRVESGNFWLSENPTIPGSKSWGTAFTRMVTWIKLRPKGGGQAFCVFNTHFDVWGKRARVESAKLLRREMQQIAPDLPTIVTGDFNDEADASPTYRTMLAGSSGADVKLIDTFRVAHPTPTGEDGTMHSFNGRRDGARIDWIFTTGSFQTIASGIDHTSDGSKYPSDHFPMVSIVRPTALADRTALAQ